MMELFEQGLRQRLTTEQLLGCYAISEETGKGFFKDIRGGEGEVFEIGDEEIIIPYHDNSLIPGEFYGFDWRIRPGTKEIEVTGNVALVEKDAFLDTLFNVNFQLRGKALQDSINTQESTFSEVTGSDHTFLYELLQNANDYPYRNEPVKVKFILTEHYLFFFHTGAEFNLRNIVGICSINQGEKRKNTETIGYKGIGFKTVFVNNDYVFLRSGDWHFRFDKAYSEAKMNGKCAWSMMPIRTEVQELDEEARPVIESVGDEYRVRFALRHKTAAGDNIVQIDKVFSDDQILLFIPKLGSVEIIVPGRAPQLLTKDTEKWVIDSFPYVIPDDLREWVKNNIKAGGKIPPKFSEIENIRISFAVPKEGNQIRPIAYARVYNYLPTELQIGIGALVNADFVPNGSRNGLHDVLWNNRIMIEVGRTFVTWWASLLQEEGKYDIASVFSLLPPLRLAGQYPQDFAQGFRQEIVKASCIPTVRDGKYELRPLKSTVYDVLGLTLGENQVMTDEEFYDITGTSFTLPHKSIRSNKGLIKLYEENPNCGFRFTSNILCSYLKTQKMQEWLLNKENNLKFLQFFSRKGSITLYTAYPVFLSATGKLCNAGALYLNLDKYMDDLGFMEDLLPRLDPTIRVELEKITNWRHFADSSMSFKRFNVALFIKNISWKDLYERLQERDNSVGMIHFMAKHVDIYSVPNDFPFINDAGDVVSWDDGNLFISSEFGDSIRNRPWFSSQNISFIHPDYLKNDSGTVQKYLVDRVGLRALHAGTFYQLFLQDEQKMASIANCLDDINASRDFYVFLSQIKDYDIRFTPKMRENYTLLCTDGKNEEILFVGSPIYFHDSTWEEIRKESWMPEDFCYALSEKYYEGLTEGEQEDLKDFLKSKQLVESFTQGEFAKRELIPYLDDFCDSITKKEYSRDFLDYLFVYRKAIFRNERPSSVWYQIPVFCEGSDSPTTRKDNRTGIYYHGKTIDNLLQQPWCAQMDVPILDHHYDSLFDGKERIDFYKDLGFIVFSLQPFIYRTVFSHTKGLADILSDRDANLAFHRYFCENKDLFPGNEMESLREVPIYLVSPDDPDGILAESAEDHYLPSEELTKIVQMDIVPLDLLDSIHPDYIQSEKDLDYYQRILNNTALSTDQFIDYIHKQTDVLDYLQEDVERNIRFWRWAASSKSGNRAKLKNVALLGHRFNAAKEQMTTADKLSLSNKYSDILNFEAVVHRFNSTALFVSERYFEDGDDVKDWVSLFRSIGVTTENKDLVFNRILPHLDELKMTEIVPMIARYTDDIANRLRRDDKELLQQLNGLHLCCTDGRFRLVREVMISGKYLGIDHIPFPEIQIFNMVTEKYLQGEDGDSERVRQVKSFFCVLADTFKNGLDTLTELRDYQIRSYLSHQKEIIASKPELHYKIIGHLAEEYGRDMVGIRELVGKESILLLSKSGKVLPPSQLYLGTAYKPDCDFEAHGISSIPYVSDQYQEFSPEARAFLCSVARVRSDFDQDNLPLLSNEEFSYYFWKEYAVRPTYFLEYYLTEENLKDIACIPTVGGVKKPRDLYDYRVADLKKMVLAISPDGVSDRLPAVELPKWLHDVHLGFRPKLFLEDCLSYLKLNTHDFRKKVYNWIAEYDDIRTHSCKEQIRQFRETALWYNGKREWVPLSGLVAMEWGNKTLRDYFSSNASVCNPSYMPEERHVFERLCEIFGIKIITNEDFQKVKVGRRDEEAIAEIGKRLLYVAYKTDPENWEELHERYMDVIEKADICTCSSIEYRFNDAISTTMRSYFEEDTALWYLGAWNGPLFVRILEWLKRVLKLTNETNMLESIFLEDFNVILNNYEESLPESFLQRLAEEDRKGIKVSEDEVIEEFSDVFDEAPQLDAYEPSFTPRPAPRGYGEQLDDLDDEALENSRTAVQKEPSSPVPRAAVTPTRTSAAATKRESPEPPGTQPHARAEKKSLALDSKQDTIPPLKEFPKPVSEKLNEFWNAKYNAPVQKPHTAASSFEESFETQESAKRESQAPSFEAVSVQPSTRQNSRARMERDIKKHATEAQNAAEKANERIDLLNLMEQTPEYSFLWFKLLMRLMFGEVSKSSVRTAQIDFMEYEIINDRAFTLRLPSKAVPNWFNDTQQVSVLPIGINRRKIIATVLLAKDDYLYLSLAAEDDVDLGKEFSGASKFRVNASTTSMSIDDCLETRFVQLGFNDSFNMKDNLPSAIQYIYGPPGTGKTTWLTRKIVEMLSGAEESKDILILTPTNKAADVISEMLLGTEMSDYLYRYGATERLSLIESGKVVTRDDDFFRSGGHHIVVTTATRFSYDNIYGDDICDMSWDTIIIDEASMLDIVSTTFILYKGDCQQFIIAGDPKQIQPVAKNSIQPQNIYEMVGLDSFAQAKQKSNVVALSVQYRSIPAIGELVSRFSYNGMVLSHRQNTNAKPLVLDKLGQVKPVNYVGFKIEPLDELYGLDSIGGSALHIYSSVFAYNFAEYVAKEIGKRYTEEYSIGIVCPYKAEAEAIGQMIENRSIDTQNCHIHCGTVHSFQGDQCDIMFVVLNPPADCTSGTHINDRNIINVAMSRAKDYLFFLIPDSPVSGFPIREELGRTVDQQFKQIHSCADLEMVMFGMSDYLARNVNVSCHMPVNVYYEPSRLYEVKINEDAVDIQINESLRTK